MLENRSDKELAQRILRELKWDSRIEWASINVAVNNSVATLTGVVSSYARKIAAPLYSAAVRSDAVQA